MSSPYIVSDFKIEYMNTPWYVRLTNAIVMIFRTIFMYLYLIPRLFIKSDLIIDPLTLYMPKWKCQTRGLYVIVHGLKGSPNFSSLTIGKYIDQHYKDQYDIIIPIVPNGGNCELEKAGEPILNLVIDFIDKNPSKPIHLIGSSNGARIVTFIETMLRKFKNTNIRVTSIGGVYYGSDNIALLKSTRFANCILHDDILNSLTTGSNKAIKLINSMQMQHSSKRSYEFYATANDWYIPNFDSCYPTVYGINDITYHPLVTGVDHTLLGHHLAQNIIERSVKWMNFHQM